MLNVKSKSKDTHSLSDNRKIIALTLQSNRLSSTIIIPIELARLYALDRPSHVTIEDTQNGILIKGLEVKN